MTPELTERVERAAGERVVSATAIVGRGYTPAARFVLSLEHGTSAFLKAATSDDTAAWLRTERRVYEALGPRSFLPAVRGWSDGNDGMPFLLLEDLSGAQWPPPWDAARVDAVRDALAAVAATEPPPFLPRLEASRAEFTNWPRIVASPDAFLSLRLCTRAWLDAALPTLIAAEADCVLDGDDLLHLDVRSDNLCLRGDRAVFVDWNWACVGNGAIDIAGWLPSLATEGGPSPESILPDAGPEAALICGFFAGRAGLPPIPDAPRVRAVQYQQLTTALPWAARALGLPVPERP